MEPLRIIIVMLEPPLLFGSAAARWYAVLLKELVARGHQVTAYATCSNPDEIQKVKLEFPPPRFDLRCFPHPKRFGLKAKLETFQRPYSYMFSPDLRTDLAVEMKNGFDILHLEQLWCGWLLDQESIDSEYRKRALINLHYLSRIDLQNAPTPGLRSYLDKQLMFGAEKKLLRDFEQFRSCTSRITEETLKLNSRAKINTLPFALDLDAYEYLSDDRRSAEPVLSLIGSMDWYPSRSAAMRLLSRLWPRIKKEVPNARLQIIGWNARGALSQYLHFPDVTILENVPEIQPYFESAGVLLYAPERGSGMKIKIMEAFAYGVPVVTTSEGVEGLPALDGLHAGICEDDSGLVERTVTLLRNPDKQNRQRRLGRQLLETHCSPNVILNGIEKTYSEILRSFSKETE